MLLKNMKIVFQKKHCLKFCLHIPVITIWFVVNSFILFFSVTTKKESKYIALSVFALLLFDVSFCLKNFLLCCGVLFFLQNFA